MRAREEKRRECYGEDIFGCQISGVLYFTEFWGDFLGDIRGKVIFKYSMQRLLNMNSNVFCESHLKVQFIDI